MAPKKGSDDPVYCEIEQTEDVSTAIHPGSRIVATAMVDSIESRTSKNHVDG